MWQKTGHLTILPRIILQCEGPGREGAGTGKPLTLMAFGHNFTTRVQAWGYYARGPFVPNVSTVMSESLPPQILFFPGPEIKAQIEWPAQDLCSHFPYQCDAEVKGGSIFLENFEVGPLGRVTVHSDFRVRCWKVVVIFLVNSIPISNSSAPWCSHCPMCWHTWNREGVHTLDTQSAQARDKDGNFCSTLHQNQVPW